MWWVSVVENIYSLVHSDKVKNSKRNTHTSNNCMSVTDDAEKRSKFLN